MSDLEGVMLSDYLLLKCISKGGVADVYHARQDGEGKYEVAVKVFRPGYAQREAFRSYFMAEAEKIGQFDHPNILPFLEFGEGEGLLYTVTPFVASGTLEDLLMRVGGRFSAMQALPIIQQLCSAVQYAHNHDVIHGNIKPTNVLVTADGRMLLSDFSIAHGYDDSQQSLTRIGWGSAEYAAPEQSLGILRQSSDIYALGVLLYRILAGRPPFTGQTPVEVLLKHVRQRSPSVRALVPSISDAVDGVLEMALQKRSEDRFA
ncbi:MAG: serine/threonine protein kinase [Ktedonobacteraceae bacterium]